MKILFSSLLSLCLFTLSATSHAASFKEKVLDPKDFVDQYNSVAPDNTVTQINITNQNGKFLVEKCTIIENQKDCSPRGSINKIVRSRKFKEAYMTLKNIEGEKVPTWTFSNKDETGKYQTLTLKDYDASLDVFVEEAYTRFNRRVH